MMMGISFLDIFGVPKGPQSSTVTISRSNDMMIPCGWFDGPFLESQAS